MIKPLLIGSLLAFSLSLKAQTKKVLFLGNSYTAANNLPQLFSDLALSLGDSVVTAVNSPGGYTFQQHCGNATSLSLISAQPWDYVVLQEQSQLPSFPPAQVALDVYPYARYLDSLIRLNHPCTETVFYMTWGRKYGDASNCVVWPPVCTFTGMQQQLRASYVQMANDNQALVAPCGMAWQQSWTTDSTIDLWVSDNSHPSLAGSYLNACVLYSTIFRKTTVAAPFDAFLGAGTATFLQQVAYQIVNDSLPVWNIGDYDPLAAFAYAPSGLQVQFTESCQNSNSYQWDFGDGSGSILPSPLHTYPGAGIYQVQLIAGNACASDTLVQGITVAATGLQESSPAGSCIRRTAQSVLLDCGTWPLLEIYNAEGRLLRTEALPPGCREYRPQLPEGQLYLLIFRNPDRARVACTWLQQ